MGWTHSITTRCSITSVSPRQWAATSGDCKCHIRTPLFLFRCGICSNRLKTCSQIKIHFAGLCATIVMAWLKTQQWFKSQIDSYSTLPPLRNTSFVMVRSVSVTLPNTNQSTAARNPIWTKKNDPLPPSCSGRLGTTQHELQSNRNNRSSGYSSISTW